MLLFRSEWQCCLCICSTPSSRYNLSSSRAENRRFYEYSPIFPHGTSNPIALQQREVSFATLYIVFHSHFGH